jgi:hypothetical protein
MKSLGVLTIATRQYFKYWEQMIRSAEENFSNEIIINFHVFTDQYNSALEIALTSPYLNVIPHQIDDLGWPEATLKRYEIITNHKESYSEDYLLHLDADMLFKAPLSSLCSELEKQNIVSLVRHPGFYRPEGVRRILFYIGNPRFVPRDLKAKLSLGGIGAWETDIKSNAYVPRNLRSNYFCGATWFGPKAKVLDLCQNLSSNVDADRESGITAKWHDESHLNRWATINEFNALKPNFCFDPTFPQLQQLEEIIRAVDKRK